ncbi:MAG: nucleotide exchange factor GrpE [Planctomycetota bacterium]|jgi:molecular chaperone GrpE
MKKRKQNAPEKTADVRTEATAGEDTPAGADTPSAEATSKHTHDDDHEHPKPDTDVDELTQARQERDKHYEQLQRALADLQNFRKRRGQDMAEIRQLAVEGLTAELLPVLDNFHLATDAASTGADNDNGEGDGGNAVREGLLMVKAMLEGVLERHGLREIPAAGQAFDHALHEAVGLAEASEVPPGQVAQVVQKGYFLGDRVLRHAKVLVAGDMPARPEGDANAQEGHGHDEER